MASNHSYGATRQNNKTESIAVQYLLSENSRFRLPNKAERKAIMEKLHLDKSFSRAFDLVMLLDDNVVSLLEVPADNLVLIELKTTKKKLMNIPDGFFFGATENEFRLAKMLGDKFRFCFVSLHPESQNYVLLTSEEVERRIKTKRIQYQINL